MGWRTRMASVTTRREHQRVPFRLISMPCCGFHLCWVNPRMPLFCPECGNAIGIRVRGAVIVEDMKASLTIHLESS